MNRPTAAQVADTRRSQVGRNERLKDSMTLGEQLTKQREAHALNLQALAAKAGLEESMVVCLEAEDGTARDLVKLVRGLGCRLEVVPDAVLRLLDDVSEGIG